MKRIKQAIMTVVYATLNEYSFRKRVKHQGCEKPLGYSHCRLVWGHDGAHKPMWGDKR